MGLTIVGLGPGHIDDLTRRAWKTLEQAQAVYLRTSRHPCVPHLPVGPIYHSFDDIYEANADFANVYATIIERLVEASHEGAIVYAVPGDPLVGESTVTGLLQKLGDQVRVVSGISFIEPTLVLVGVDALDGLQLLDALTIAAMHHPPINPDLPALLAQVYSRDVASNVKLTLMNQYPDDFEVTLIHGAGTSEGVVERLPLYEIDRSEHIEHLTALFLPALGVGGMTSFESFQETIAHLRAPEGCPWDREQTHQTLRQNLIEEAYEVVEAIDNLEHGGDSAALAEEMGDLLLQIVLQTQIAIDDGEFNMTDVIGHINRKMIHRHPHVWGDVTVSGADDVTTNWEKLKREENAKKAKPRESLLDGAPKGLPALLQAHTYGRKASKARFDWEHVEDVIAKVREEIDEIQSAQTDDERASELGDLLFAVVNWSRWLNVEPESALREANGRFYRRFRYIEEAVAKNGKPFDAYTLAELDALWNEAKSTGL